MEALLTVSQCGRKEAFTSMQRLCGAVLLALFALSGWAQVSGPIVVYPTKMTIEIGTSRQMSAYVPISPNTVVWSVNDVPGGNSTVGTVSTTGLYAAPLWRPHPTW